MKNYSSRTKGSSRRNFLSSRGFNILVVVGALLLMLWLSASIFGMLFAVVTKPIYSVETWFRESAGTVPEYFRGRTTLLNEIKSLQSELSNASGHVATIERLSKENDEYRALLNGVDADRIAVSVIGRPPTLPYDSLLIDQGSMQGISEGAVVYHHDDRAVGYISRAYVTSALVTLFSTANAETTAYVYGPDVFARMYGEGGGVIRVSIPQGLPIAEGDVVVLPTLESGVIGEISTVVSNPTEPEQNAFVTLGSSLQSIRFLSVGKEVIERVTFDEALEHVEMVRNDIFSVEVPIDYQGIIASSSPTSTAAVHEAELE